MKKCPFCAEEIQDVAIKCKQCKRLLPESDASIAVLTDKKSSRGLIVAGYICSFLSLGFIPFSIAGLIVGVMNIKKGGVRHGVWQIVISIISPVGFAIVLSYAAQLGFFN